MSVVTTTTTTTSMSSELASSVSAENENDNENENENVNDDDQVGWRSNLPRGGYASPLLWESRTEWKTFMKKFNDNNNNNNNNNDDNNNDDDNDHLWEQVKLEALSQLSTEPEAGPQLYQSILSQGSLVEAIVTIIARTLFVYFTLLYNISTLVCLLQVPYALSYTHIHKNENGQCRYIFFRNDAYSLI